MGVFFYPKSNTKVYMHMSHVSVPIFVNFGLLSTEREFFKLGWCLHQKPSQATPTFSRAAITWYFRATSSLFIYLLWPPYVVIGTPLCFTPLIYLLLDHIAHTTVRYGTCYRPSSVVCRSVCWSVSSEPCKNDWTDRETISVEDSGGPREPCSRWGPDTPRGNFGERRAHC